MNHKHCKNVNIVDIVDIYEVVPFFQAPRYISWVNLLINCQEKKMSARENLLQMGNFTKVSNRFHIWHAFIQNLSFRFPWFTFPFICNNFSKV